MSRPLSTGDDVALRRNAHSEDSLSIPLVADEKLAKLVAMPASLFREATSGSTPCRPTRVSSPSSRATTSTC